MERPINAWIFTRYPCPLRQLQLVGRIPVRLGGSGEPLAEDGWWRRGEERAGAGGEQGRARKKWWKTEVTAVRRLSPARPELVTNRWLLSPSPRQPPWPPGPSLGRPSRRLRPGDPTPAMPGPQGGRKLPGPLPRLGPVEVGCPRPEGCPGGWPPRPRPARPGQASPAALRQAGPRPGPHATARAAGGWGSSGQRAWACAYHA